MDPGCCGCTPADPDLVYGVCSVCNPSPRVLCLNFADRFDQPPYSSNTAFNRSFFGGYNPWLRSGTITLTYSATTPDGYYGLFPAQGWYSPILEGDKNPGGSPSIPVDYFLHIACTGSGSSGSYGIRLVERAGHGAGATRFPPYPPYGWTPPTSGPGQGQSTQPRNTSIGGFNLAQAGNSCNPFGMTNISVGMSIYTSDGAGNQSYRNDWFRGTMSFGVDGGCETGFSARDSGAATSTIQGDDQVRLAMAADLCPMGSGPCGCGPDPRLCGHPDRPLEVWRADCLRCVSLAEWSGRPG